jgi:hypothetical protein
MLTAKDKQGLRMMGTVGAILIGLMALSWYLQSQPQPADDNCIGVPRSSTVIVIDNTQEITEQTRREIIARADAYVRDSVHDNERVSIFRVSAGSEDSLVPVLSVCKPRSTGSALIEDERSIARRFRENFQRPLKEALEVPPAESPTSPIAAAMVDLSLSAYLRADTNRVLLFSDLLENSPGFTLYGCRDGDEAIRAFREARKGAMERPHFRNTHVFLNIIPRTDLPRSMTTACRDKFWMWFFGDNVGGSLTPDFLPGN